MAKKFVVTPWEVKGKIDYDKLIRQFGVKKFTPELAERLKRITGDLHIYFRRDFILSHRDFDWLLDEYEKGNKFFLYTGRGPSNKIHLGHVSSYLFMKWLQDKFDAKLYFQLTDDEKFLFKRKLGIDEANDFAYENALDIIALGFKQGKTLIFSDIDYAKTLYKQAIRVAKKLTFSTARAVFGFTNNSNVGQIFFASMQAVPTFLESVRQGRNVPCLILHGIDQDPYFRVARDINPKIGFYKPATIHNKFFPGLSEEGKMSASEPSSAIFTTDSSKEVKKKIMTAFTGGRDTSAEQKRLGGRPENCPIYHYYKYLFEPDDEKLEQRLKACSKGKLLCGECKAELIPRIQEFLKEHQKKRELARNKLDKFIVKD